MSRSGQASYHIDLDAALLGPSRGSGQPIALVADATSGLALLDPQLARDAIPRPPLLSPASARTLMAHEYRQSVRVREPVLRSYRDALTQRGYRIVGVPELRTRELNENASGLPEIVYCNVLPGLNRGLQARRRACDPRGEDVVPRDGCNGTRRRSALLLRSDAVVPY
jgi:hypothetical protein